MDSHELPLLREVFTELRKGKHLCLEDGPLYGALAAHRDDYQNLFTALGLNLVFHDRGFFYLDDESAPRTAQRMILFTAILVETLDDQGINLDEKLLEIPILPDKLPHLRHEKYAKVMGEVDVTTEDSLLKVLEALRRYGLAEAKADGTWRFRTSAYRLLDILNLAGRFLVSEQGGPPGHAIQNASPTHSQCAASNGTHACHPLDPRIKGGQSPPLMPPPDRIGSLNSSDATTEAH